MQSFFRPTRIGHVGLTPSQVFRQVCAALTVICCLFAVPESAWSQTGLVTSGSEPESPSLPDPLTREAVRDVVSLLSEHEVRMLLVERLDAMVAAAEQAEQGRNSASAMLGKAISDTYSSISQAIVRAPELPAGVWSGFERFFAPRGWSGTLALLGVFALAMAMGVAAELAVNRLARRWRARIQAANPDSFLAALDLFVRRIVLDAIGLVLFYVVARQVLQALLSTEAPATADGTRSFPDSLIAVTFLWSAVMVPRAMRTLTRFLFAPRIPALRLVHTDDGNCAVPASAADDCFRHLGSDDVLSSIPCKPRCACGRIAAWLLVQFRGDCSPDARHVAVFDRDHDDDAGKRSGHYLVRRTPCTGIPLHLGGADRDHLVHDRGSRGATALGRLYQRYLDPGDPALHTQF